MCCCMWLNRPRFLEGQPMPTARNSMAHESKAAHKPQIERVSLGDGVPPASFKIDPEMRCVRPRSRDGLNWYADLEADLKILICRVGNGVTMRPNKGSTC